MELRHDGKFVIFDFETESTNLCYRNRPWQMAYMICQGNRVLKKEDRYIWWDDLNISEGAKRITRFDYNKYKSKATPARETLEELQGLFANEDYFIAGHNIIGFDVLVYQTFLKALGEKPDFSFAPRMIDTLCLAKALHLGIELQYEDLFAQQLGMAQTICKGAKLTLGALCKKFEIELNEEKMHDAFEDIEKNRIILNKLLWKCKL